MSWYENLKNLNNQLTEGVNNGSSADPNTNSFYNKLKNLNKELTQGVYDAASPSGKKIIESINGVRQPDTKNDSTSDPTSAPPKVSSAPTANSITVFTGLCDALNEFQQREKKLNRCEIPDQYEILFAPSSLGEFDVQLPGLTNYQIVGMANNTKNARNKLPSTNKMDSSTRIIQVTAGTQIVQFIDQVMRTSSYINNQANGTYDATTGTFTPNPTLVNSNKGIVWYKITFQATPLGWDSIRHDLAYKMTYIINQFLVTDLNSQFFNPGAFRGVHKSFNYWFTGQNTQVLNFEQDYNQMYWTVLTAAPDSTGTATAQALKGLSNNNINPANDIPPISTYYAPQPGASAQYGSNGSGLIGASAADYLYGVTNQGKVRIKIVGDPGLIVQGEVVNEVTAQNFTWEPFYADGSINTDASQVLFDIIFNRPNDYNFSTGLVDVNGTNTVNGVKSLLQPQAHLIYTASGLVSTFRQGKFEQELEGILYRGTMETAQKQAQSNARNTKLSITDITSRLPSISNGDASKFSNIVNSAGLGWPGFGTGQPTGSPNPNTDANAVFISNPPTQAQPPAEAPTSNGEVVQPVSNDNTNNGTETTNSNPQVMAPTDDSSDN